MNLPRLTRERLRNAEKHGKFAGWYALAKRGYVAEEISIHAESAHTPADVNVAIRNYCDRHNLPWPATIGRRREIRERRNVTDWREAFRGTVMRTGLSLHITQTQLEQLCAISESVWPDRGSMADRHFLVTCASLEKRGLIRKPSEGEQTKKGRAWLLTPIGDLLVRMLKEAGVFWEADEAILRNGTRMLRAKV